MLPYLTLRVFSQIKDRKHIEQNFHSVAGIMPQGWDLGCWGSKTLAWGFAMASHRLRVPGFHLKRVVGTQKNHLNEKVLLSNQKHISVSFSPHIRALYWLSPFYDVIKLILLFPLSFFCTCSPAEFGQIVWARQSLRYLKM